MFYQVQMLGHLVIQFINVQNSRNKLYTISTQFFCLKIYKCLNNTKNNTKNNNNTDNDDDEREVPIVFKMKDKNTVVVYSLYFCMK